MSLSEQPLFLPAVGWLKYFFTHCDGINNSWAFTDTLLKTPLLTALDTALQWFWFGENLVTQDLGNSLILMPEKACPLEPLEQAQRLLPAALSSDVKFSSALSVRRSCMSKAQDPAMVTIWAKVHPFWCCQSTSCEMKKVHTQLHSVMDSYFLINYFEAFWNNAAQWPLILKPN